MLLDSDLREIEVYINKQLIMALGVAFAVSGLAYLLAIGFQRTISGPVLNLAATGPPGNGGKGLFAARSVTTKQVPPPVKCRHLSTHSTPCLWKSSRAISSCLKKNEELGKAKEVARNRQPG